jgi:hypothetical protein
LLQEIPLRIDSYSTGEWEAWFEGDVLQEIIDLRQDTGSVDHLHRFQAGGARMGCLQQRGSADRRGTLQVPFSRWRPMVIRSQVIYGMVLDSNAVQSVVKGRIRRP